MISIARHARTLRTTSRSFFALTLPIDTWSSLPADDGIESTLAGWQSTLFSLTSDALVDLRDHEARVQAALRPAGAGTA